MTHSKQIKKYCAEQIAAVEHKLPAHYSELVQAKAREKAIERGEDMTTYKELSQEYIRSVKGHKRYDLDVLNLIIEVAEENEQKFLQKIGSYGS